MQITSAKPFSRYRLSKNERKEPRVDNAAVKGKAAYHIQNGKKTLSGWHNSRNLGSHDSRGKEVRHEQ